MTVMSSALAREPVLILLEGIAAVVNVILVALVTLDVISLTGEQTVAVVAAVQGVTTLAAAVVRGQVYSPATHAQALTPPDPTL